MLPQCFQRRLNLFRLGRVVRIQHSPNDGFPEAELDDYAYDRLTDIGLCR
jgi:hypothetical protein